VRRQLLMLLLLLRLLLLLKQHDEQTAQPSRCHRTSTARPTDAEAAISSRNFIERQNRRMQLRTLQLQQDRSDHISPGQCTPITPGGDGMIRPATRRYLQRTRYNALLMGRKTLKFPPSPWDFVTVPKNQAKAIGNMHKNGKDRACGSGDILSDRQTHILTDRQTERHTDILITILRNRSRGRSNN